MRILGVVAPVVVAMVAACGRSAPATSGGPVADTGAARPAVELGAASQLDSGNTSYRARDYTGALAHYRAAAERQPRLAAAWFGVYMAQAALGDKAGADSAMARAQSLDPGMTAGHPTAGQPESAGALPPGHPRMGPGALPKDHPTPSSR